MTDVVVDVAENFFGRNDEVCHFPNGLRFIQLAIRYLGLPVWWQW